MKKYQSIFLMMFFMFSTLFTTVAYAGLSQRLAITGEAEFRVPADIRVTGISIGQTNGNVYNYTPKYSKETITMGFNLAASSSITYNVTVRNSGDIDQTIYDMTTVSTNNQGVTCSLTGYNKKDVIGYRDSVTFGVTCTSAAAAENVNIVLQFDFRKVYYVTYDANSGTNAPSAQIKYENEDLEITSDEPTKANYSFLGWSDTSNAQTAQYEPGDTYTLNSDKLLYAVWQVNSYKVTYDKTTNGGTGPNEEETVNYNESIDLTKTASKTGWTFVGWNTNQNATTALSNLTIGEQAVTLYAIYSKTLTGTFNYYNSESTTVTATIYNTETSGTITAPGALGQTSAYTFNGWSTSVAPNPENNKVGASASITISNDIGYYASYTYSVTGIFVYYDGSAYTSTANVATAYMNYSGSKTGAAPTVPTVSTPSGWTNRGWATGTSGDSALVTPSTITTHQTYYYTYSKSVTATVCVYNNSCSDKPTTSAYLTSYNNGTIKDASIDLGTTSLNGYTFRGWSESNTANATVLQSNTVSINTNKTYYASYSYTVTITYTANGGSTPTTSSINTTAAAYMNYTGTKVSGYVTMPAATTREGYTFEGWGTNNYEAGEVVYFDADTTLAAQWSANNYTVTFKYNDRVTSDTTKQLTYNSAYGTLPSPTREGYTFDGWYLANDILPNAYQQVDYIESTGSQYIDVDYIPKTNTKLELDLSFNGQFKPYEDYGGNNTFLGVHESDGKSSFAINFGAGNYEGQGNGLYPWFNKYYQVDGQGVEAFGITDAIRTNRNTLIVENGKISYGSVSRTISSKSQNNISSMYLFGSNDKRSPKQPSFSSYNMRVYKMNIYENDELKRVYIPCYRKSDSKPGLYDTVSGTFYVNSGSGSDFNIGPKVLPNAYQQVDYIQSTGTQYIDTGYYWQHENVEINFDGRVISNSSSQSLFGNEEYTTSSGNTGNNAGIPYGSNGSYSIYIGNGSQGTVNTTLGKRFKLRIKTDSNKNLTVFKDGSQVINKTYGGTVLTNQNAYISSNSSTTVGDIFIFANHNSSRGSSNDPTQNIGGMELYNFQLIDNGVLVRNFIPCYRKSDNKPGLYDTVSETFYTNQASGDDFIIGSNTDNYNVKIESTTSVTIPQNHTLSAKWEPNDYTVTFDENINLIYGLEDTNGEINSFTSSGETATIMKYTITNGNVEVTALANDGYGLTSGRVYLEANKTYIFNCDTDGTWGFDAGSDTVEALFMLNGQFNLYYHMTTNRNMEFTPTTTGTYWLRLDVNKNGEKYNFWNISVKEKPTQTKSVTYDSTYGTLPTPQRNGYTFKGWNGKNNFNINKYVDITNGVTKDSSDWITVNTSSGVEYYNFYTENLNIEEGKTYQIVVELRNTSNVTGTLYITSNQPGYSNQFESKGIDPDSLNSNEILIYNITSRDNPTGPNQGLRTFYHNLYRNTNETLTFRISVLDVSENITEDNFEYEPYYVTSSTNVTQAKDHTLTAIWEPASYTITLDPKFYTSSSASSASVTPTTSGTTSITSAYNTSLSPTSISMPYTNTLSATNGTIYAITYNNIKYGFEGYYEGKACTGTQRIKDDGTYTNFTSTTYTSDQTLYACWKKINAGADTSASHVNYSCGASSGCPASSIDTVQKALDDLYTKFN